jgi:hypothetical protein
LDKWENGDRFPDMAESFLSYTASRSTLGTVDNAAGLEVPLALCFILIV